MSICCVKGCFQCGSAGKEFTCNVGDLGLIPGLGRSSGEGKGYPLQYSGLEDPMDYIKESDTTEWALLYVQEIHKRVKRTNYLTSNSCILDGWTRNKEENKHTIWFQLVAHALLMLWNSITPIVNVHHFSNLSVHSNHLRSF